MANGPHTLRLVMLMLLMYGCGESMTFENAGSQQTLEHDEQDCLRWLSDSDINASYSQSTQGRLDPLQVCMEHKGWNRVYSLAATGGKAVRDQKDVLQEQPE